MSIKVNLAPLESTAAFPYLGHTIVYNNSDCKALYHNLGNSSSRWYILLRVMDKTGAMMRYRAMMYKTLVHKILFMEARFGRSRIQ